MFTKREFDLLMLLLEEKKSLSQRELAERLECSLGTINKILKDFMEKCFYDGKNITEKCFDALEDYRVRRAVFVAAGFGSRLAPITLNTPKPLIRVKGKRIIDTLIDACIKAEIKEIYIVRGYLSEQFDQLLYKYPMIKFIENPYFNETNNISSAMCARYLLKNAYVLEADLVLYNDNIIRKYEYSSNILGIKRDVTDDWCVTTDSNGYVIKEEVGGKDCYQIAGISYWTADDGAKLSEDIKDVYQSPGGKERYWEQAPLVYKKENYKVKVRECSENDISEIDTFSELKNLDKSYDL